MQIEPEESSNIAAALLERRATAKVCMPTAPATGAATHASVCAEFSADVQAFGDIAAALLGLADHIALEPRVLPLPTSPAAGNGKALEAMPVTLALLVLACCAADEGERPLFKQVVAIIDDVEQELASGSFTTITGDILVRASPTLSSPSTPCPSPALSRSSSPRSFSVAQPSAPLLLGHATCCTYPLLQSTPLSLAQSAPHSFAVAQDTTGRCRPKRPRHRAALMHIYHPSQAHSSDARHSVSSWPQWVAQRRMLIIDLLVCSQPQCSSALMPGPPKPPRICKWSPPMSWWSPWLTQNKHHRCRLRWAPRARRRGRRRRRPARAAARSKSSASWT